MLFYWKYETKFRIKKLKQNRISHYLFVEKIMEKKKKKQLKAILFIYFLKRTWIVGFGQKLRKFFIFYLFINFMLKREY